MNPQLTPYPTNYLEEWLARLKALWPDAALVKTLEDEIVERKKVELPEGGK
jgi:hypothetical protein